MMKLKKNIICIKGFKTKIKIKRMIIKIEIKNKLQDNNKFSIEW